MKNEDFCLRDWLDKFEALLRRMYWKSAYVHVKGGYIGAFEFTWKATEAWMNALRSGSLSPIDEWIFESTMDAKRLPESRNSRAVSDWATVQPQNADWFKCGE